jgi:ABC-type amino acid transport substrate-binding protein
MLSGCGSKEGKAPDAMASINKNKFVRIATEMGNLPFEYGLDTSVQGFDIDIGNEIAKDFGFEARWIKMPGYNKLFETLKNGEVEVVISAVTPNSKLKEDFAFSQPYYDSGDGIARRKNESDIKDLSGLSGKKVGVGEGRPGDLFMASQQTATGVTIEKYQNLDEALAALNRTELDAIVGDEPILSFSGFKSFPNVITLPTEINKYQYAVAVRKGDETLLASINKTLDRLKQSGELAAFEKKWLEDVLAQAEDERIRHEKIEELKISPKRVDVRINKKSGSFKMDRLDGFVLVLEGPSGTYQSTPILTEGNSGNCRFTKPVPPGEYKLNMDIFKTTTTVQIQKFPKDALSMTIDYISDKDGIRIEIK